MGCLTSRLWRRFAGNRHEDAVLLSDGASRSLIHKAVALCNFPSHRSDEHSVIFGDRLNIISEDDEMLRVFSTSSGTEHFIPHTYVSKVHDQWLFEGITRRNAEQLLSLPKNYSGCFLIRERQSCPGSYSLSVRQDRGPVHHVKHYKIHQLHNGWFYIHPNHPFSDLSQLVDYYSRSNRTCFQLIEPCLLRDFSTSVTRRPSLKAMQKSGLNWKDLSKSMTQRQLIKGSDQESLVSEGLRETMNSYFYFTEDSNWED